MSYKACICMCQQIVSLSRVGLQAYQHDETCQSQQLCCITNQNKAFCPQHPQSYALCSCQCTADFKPDSQALNWMQVSSRQLAQVAGKMPVVASALTLASMSLTMRTCFCHCDALLWELCCIGTKLSLMPLLTKCSPVLVDLHRLLAESSNSTVLRAGVHGCSLPAFDSSGLRASVNMPACCSVPDLANSMAA